MLYTFTIFLVQDSVTLLGLDSEELIFMQKTRFNRPLCFILALMVVMSSFVMTASAAYTYKYVSGDTTATMATGISVSANSTHNVTIDYSTTGHYNCSVWFQSGSNLVGQKTLYYNDDFLYYKWNPTISVAGTYSLYLYNNASAGQTFYLSYY